MTETTESVDSKDDEKIERENPATDRADRTAAHTIASGQTSEC